MDFRQIYLDHNATTPLHDEVKKALADAMGVFGNPSSVHAFGRPARQLVENARERVATFIGAAPEEIVFVGSGSEANNTVLSMLSCGAGRCDCNRVPGRELITSSIEHPCILETSKCQGERGVPVAYLEVDGQGRVHIEQLEATITDDTALVSVMLANNEIGTVQDVKRIAALAHKHNALCHTDAVQAVGKIPVNVRDLSVDFLSLSGHKVYGPKGIGALYVKKGTPFCPLIRGGHQELGRRAGTENTLGIVGLGKAIEMRAAEMPDEIPRLSRLRDALREGIEERIPDVWFNGHPTECVPNTVNVSFEGAEGEAILLYLDLEGVAVSTGSACASGSLDPSHVLLATGVSQERAHGSIRISLGRENSEQDVEYVLEVLPKVIEKVRRMSTAYKGNGQ